MCRQILKLDFFIFETLNFRSPGQQHAHTHPWPNPFQRQSRCHIRSISFCDSLTPLLFINKPHTTAGKTTARQQAQQIPLTLTLFLLCLCKYMKTHFPIPFFIIGPFLPILYLWRLNVKNVRVVDCYCHFTVKLNDRSITAIYCIIPHRLFLSSVTDSYWSSKYVCCQYTSATGLFAAPVVGIAYLQFPSILWGGLLLSRCFWNSVFLTAFPYDIQLSCTLTAL